MRWFLDLLNKRGNFKCNFEEKEKYFQKKIAINHIFI